MLKLIRARGRSTDRRISPPPRYLPRATIPGGVAVIMKSIKRTLSRGTKYDERAIALAIRLGVISNQPTQSFSGSQWVTLWGNIGKALMRIEPPEPSTLRQLWADVGMYLAEMREPEFQPGRGRYAGHNKKQASQLSPAARRQLRYRQRKVEREHNAN